MRTSPTWRRIARDTAKYVTLSLLACSSIDVRSVQALSGSYVEVDEYNLDRNRAQATTLRVHLTSDEAPLTNVIAAPHIPGCEVNPEEAFSDEGGVATFTITPLAVGSHPVSVTVSANAVRTTLTLPTRINAFSSGPRVGVPADTRLSAQVVVRNKAAAKIAGYRGIVHFASTDAAATLPPDAEFGEADAGLQMFADAIVLRTIGSQYVTATDQKTGALLFAQRYDVVPPLKSLVLTGRLAVDRTAGVVADGSDGVGVDVDVRASDGTPAAGLEVSLYISGEQNVAGPLSTTDVRGHMRAELRSTRAELKTVTARASGPYGATAIGVPLQVAFTAGPAASLSCLSAPIHVAAGDLLDPIEVSLRDVYGNVAGQDGVVLSLTVSGGAVLAGTTSLSTTAGLARFDDIRVTPSGHDYVITASSPNLQPCDSPSFDVTP